MGTRGPVHIVGTGLLGASIGVALTRGGVHVTLEDASPIPSAVAAELGAGVVGQPGEQGPSLVVVAVPPEVAGSVVARALSTWPAAVVTDVASVKESVLGEVRRAGGDLTRYVGSHPMAGRERSGAAAAMADLFVGRPWVICAPEEASSSSVLVVRELAVDVGARVVHLGARAHDEAVALVSHMPQVVASVAAKCLVGASANALDLAGQGLRDTTRIAGSDPGLWAAILLGNAGPVASRLREVADGLSAAIDALAAAEAGEEGKAVAALHRLMASGNDGVLGIPGKHGGARTEYDAVTVLVPDQPGELGRLFTEVGRVGVNLEDVHIEHAGGKPVGLTTLSVPRGAGVGLGEALTAAGWRILG